MKCKANLTTCPSCKTRYRRMHKNETCACGVDLHCGNYAVPGYNYCSNHGGPAPSRNFYGIGRNVTTGKRSNSQLMRIASGYNEIQKDGRILSNRKAMEMVWVRVEQLAERIDMNEAPERMKNLLGLWEEFSKCEDGSLQSVVIKKKLGEEFDKAYHDYMAWQQMFDALQLHSKMVESEVKIMKDLKVIMTAEDAYKLVAQVMAVLLRVLQDSPNKLKEAKFELERLIGQQSGEDDSDEPWGGSEEDRGVSGPGEVDREELLYPGDQRGPDPEGPLETGDLPG